MPFAFDLSSDRSPPSLIGRAGMDLYPLPDGTETEMAAQFAADIGGSAGNIAVALCRQGYCAALLGAFSDDPVGRFVRAHLARYGVDTSHCRTLSGEFRTSLAICETRPEDSETVFYRNGAVDLQLSADDFDSSFISSAAVLIVTGTALATDPSRAAALQALDMARATGTFSILDLDHRPVSWRLMDEAMGIYADAADRCDAVIGNDDEFAVIAGSPAQAMAAADPIREEWRHFVIFKQGSAGSLTITRDHIFRDRHLSRRGQEAVRGRRRLSRQSGCRSAARDGSGAGGDAGVRGRSLCRFAARLRLCDANRDGARPVRQKPCDDL